MGGHGSCPSSLSSSGRSSSCTTRSPLKMCATLRKLVHRFRRHLALARVQALGHLELCRTNSVVVILVHVAFDKLGALGKACHEGALDGLGHDGGARIAHGFERGAALLLFLAQLHIPAKRGVGQPLRQSKLNLGKGHVGVARDRNGHERGDARRSRRWMAASLLTMSHRRSSSTSASVARVSHRWGRTGLSREIPPNPHRPKERDKTPRRGPSIV